MYSVGVVEQDDVGVAEGRVTMICECMLYEQHGDKRSADIASPECKEQAER